MKISLPPKEEWPNMAFSLNWLPQVLKDVALKVATVDGWENRGVSDVGNTVGVICHHTAGPRNGNMPSLDTLLKGRSDLPGPLAQLGLGRDGTYFVIAAGKCNHAGNGIWLGVTSGNSSFIGIEAENTGLSNDSPWPDVQMDAYRRGVAAILKHLGQGADFCAGHKEFALPPGRKTDPNFDMNVFRSVVGEILGGTAPPPSLIPAVEPPAQSGASAGRPTLRRPSTGELVKQVQAKVGVIVDGNFGPKTEAAVRAFQRDHGIVPDGIVGPKTWAKLDSVANPVP
jgi:peptidoglycan hydrolase-like protein with peptidoglycan-binding domain